MMTYNFYFRHPQGGHRFLRHIDGHVRSCADWARRFGAAAIHAVRRADTPGACALGRTASSYALRAIEEAEKVEADTRHAISQAEHEEAMRNDCSYEDPFSTVMGGDDF